MGGGISKAELLGRMVREIQDPYPGDPGQRIDTLSIARSQSCADCRLGVPTNLSSSSVTLRRIMTGDYSPSTKVFLEPSLPFKITWNGKEIDIRRMALYHPFPLRIENVQYDAALSLNDPSDSTADTVVLIPLVASASSSGFFDRIAPQLGRVLVPDPQTKTYESASVATGADWLLTKVLPINGKRVQGGYYQWFAGRGYESYKDTTNPFVHRIRWRVKQPRINFIAMESPIAISAGALTSILSLPRTDAQTAIPPVSALVTYTPCANTPAPTSPVKESFRPTPECDPFQFEDTTGDRKKVVYGIVGAIATLAVVMIGVYIGLLAAGGQLSMQTKELGDTAGEFLYKQVSGWKSIKDRITGLVTAKAQGADIGGLAGKFLKS